MNLFSVSCAQAARLLSDAQDAPLSFSARVGLRLHLAICGHCRRYSRQLRLIRSAYAASPDHLPPQHLPEARRRQIINALNRQG
jgi:hypothetical protein